MIPWILLSFAGVPLSLVLDGDSVTSATLMLLFLGTGLDITLEWTDLGSLGRMLTKLRYLLAPWGIVAVPASILLVMGKLHDIWPLASVILVAAGLPSLKAEYDDELRLIRDKSRLLFVVIRSCTLISLFLTVVAALEAISSHIVLLGPVILYLLSVPVNVRGPKELVPPIELATLYLILVASVW